MDKKFSNVSAVEGNPKYSASILRQSELYKRENDFRSEFYRDYTRILHSTAYRRLKHKTQVFFATHNDHICTRIEHVNHVVSVSYIISQSLGLNTELTSAIALGHDVGHAPFGHQGETVLKNIVTKENIDTFWHERNSLFFVDNIETLPDTNWKEQNLNLTYAVRDGIVCHCGEVDENSIIPRDENIDLSLINEPNQYSPFTWEGCVVKISDKISYLGRDIEDALLLKFLKLNDIKSLFLSLKVLLKEDLKLRELNNTNLIHILITDLCNNSNPPDGLRFSKTFLDIINSVKKFNYEFIYNSSKFDSFKKYTEIIIWKIYNTLINEYEYIKKNSGVSEWIGSFLLINSFNEWLDKYYFQKSAVYINKKLFDINNETDFRRSVIYYISGMTDNFAISVFNELNTF